MFACMFLANFSPCLCNTTSLYVNDLLVERTCYCDLPSPSLLFTYTSFNSRLYSGAMEIPAGF